MSKKRIIIYFPVFIALAIVAGIYLGSLFRQTGSSETQLFSFSPSYDKLSDIRNFILKEYVDSLDESGLTENAIQGLLKDLDPHSAYIPAEVFDEMNDPLEGSFEGIGVQFRVEKDTIMVIQSISGGPSEKAGIKAGDRIVMVDNDTLAGKNLSNKDVIDRLKGERGSAADIHVFRKGHSGLLPFNITRDIIPTYSIDVAYLLDDSIGYIRLSRFSATTSHEFEEKLMALDSLGCKSLILDLRGNSGGYLQSAIDVSDHFLPEGKTIVFTEGNKRPRRDYYSTDKGLFEGRELVVLIDEGSASASEIVAGALQDNDIGTIIGRRSFGKGLVQEQLNLPDGSALRLTVARYFTPTGRSIQKEYHGQDDAYEYELAERLYHGELTSADSIHFVDSLSFTTPGGKTVYGGGGIMPDVYVPLESGTEFIIFNKLIDRGVLHRFAFEYTDNHRNSLEKYKDTKTFLNAFVLDDQIYQSFLDYCKKEGLEITKKELAGTEKRIRTLLQAYIARNILDDAGFYPTYHQIDKAMQQALIELGDTNLNSTYWKGV